jgi:hypothetical protein
MCCQMKDVTLPIHYLIKAGAMHYAVTFDWEPRRDLHHEIDVPFRIRGMDIYFWRSGTKLYIRNKKWFN